MCLKESYKIELKRQINNDFKKEIIAFANSEGGEIYIGVDDDGEIVGVEHADDIMESITNMIHDAIRPDLTPFTAVEELTMENKSVVKVSIQRGIKRPYHLSDKGLKPSGVYIRHGISSIPLSEDGIRNMIKESDGAAFDKVRCINQSLTFQYAEQFFKENRLDFKDEQKKTLHLIDQDGYYTNAAWLLSDQCTFSIKCAVYEGVRKTKFRDRQEFEGSILKQLEDAFQYIHMNNHLSAEIKGLKRVELLEYPDEALREALINAVIHRDYDYGGSILVNIFEDRMEFISIGGLVKGIKIQDIMAGVSLARNEVIANIFYRLKLIESYGTGIRRIIECYKGMHVQPEFIPNPTSFLVILPNTRIASLDINLSDDEKIKKFIQQKGRINRKDIEKLLDCSKFKAVQLLDTLLENEEILKQGSGRTTYYIEKYYK